MEKISLFDDIPDDLDIETGGSHQTSTRISNATARTVSRAPLYKVEYVNLNDDLKAESKC